ncbi:unnamed protein product [Prorocentrum cordatum]|uniref:EF-hand domain-containing protein n=1 Tax=Prorocentrum cordatum TaxID=2364126 RepID=A0ABN9RHC3_9DINO|nr:unnamed protein product [Polarella glacialis]
MVVRMLAFCEGDRPSAREVLGEPWIASGSQACKAARAATAPAEFGLWRPRDAPGFAERARRRGRLAPRLRLIVAAMCRHLDAEALLPARLLFRWMDLSGSGFLYEKDLRQAAERVGLDPAAAAVIFSAGDIAGVGRGGPGPPGDFG